MNELAPVDYLAAGLNLLATLQWLFPASVAVLVVIVIVSVWRLSAECIAAERKPPSAATSRGGKPPEQTRMRHIRLSPGEIMKRIIIVAMITALSAVSLRGQSGPSTRSARSPLDVARGDPELVEGSGQGSDLFQKALSKERVDGQLTEAIALYDRVVKEFAFDRALAAKALLQMGRCYERLGRADAKGAYERIVQEFADQRSSAAEARARLTALRADPAVKNTPSTRQVWTGPAVGPFGAPSPDGRLLSFVDWETGNPGVRDLTTGVVRRLTNDAMEKGRFAEFSVFSPDSRQLAFGTLNFSAGTNAYELRTVGVDGSIPRTVYASAEVSFIQPFAWTPTGRQILAALSSRTGSTQLVLVEVDTGRARVLKTFDWRGVVKASMSPDGAWIAYDFPSHEDTPRRDVYLLAADGSRQITLVDHAANDLFPMWTPDGQHVVFLSDRSGGMAAWIQGVSAGKPMGSARLLKPDMRGALLLGFTARGSLYYSQDPQTDIYVTTMDPGTGSLIRPAVRASEHLVGANTSPDWSPDGRQLVYVSRRLELPKAQVPGGRILCVVDVESGRVRELSPPLASMDRPRWSPDGRSILVNAQQNGRYGLYGVDATSGDFAQLVRLDAGTGLNSAAWSRDGSALFYITYGTDAVSEIGPGQPVIRRDLESGHERIIDASPGPKSDLAVSHDGKWLAYRATGQAAGASQPMQTIRIISVDGGSTRDLGSLQIAGYRGLNWTPDDRFLIFATANRTDHRYDLARVAASGGAPERIAQGLALDILFLDARLHPDGRRLAFRSGEGNGTGEIWAMDNLLPARDAPAAKPGRSR